MKCTSFFPDEWCGFCLRWWGRTELCQDKSAGKWHNYWLVTDELLINYWLIINWLVYNKNGCRTGVNVTVLAHFHRFPLERRSSSVERSGVRLSGSAPSQVRRPHLVDPQTPGPSVLTSVRSNHLVVLHMRQQARAVLQTNCKQVNLKHKVPEMYLFYSLWQKFIYCLFLTPERLDLSVIFYSGYKQVFWTSTPFWVIFCHFVGWNSCF